MNSINLCKWDGIEVVEISHSGYMARIIPSIGGNIVKLSYKGEDILKTPTNLEEYKKAQNNFGIPHLFPPNRIKDGSFTFEDRKYQFPVKASGNSLHGFLHNTVWEIEKKSVNDNKVSVKVSYESIPTDEFYNYFPHKFKCTREYGLSSRGLEENYLVENLGERSLPLSVGYHTAFPLTKGHKGVRIKVSIGSKIELGSDKIPTGKVLPLSENEKSIKTMGACLNCSPFDNLYTTSNEESNTHSAIIEGLHTRGNIIYQVDDKYKYWVLCNYVNRGDIVCIEPQTSSIDAHNRDGGNLISLGAKKSWGSKNRMFIEIE